MNKKEINKITEIAEAQDWSLTVNENEFCFETYSTAGQDFSIELTADTIEELIEKINERYEDFDCSYETYIWLDETGHGKNGAPDDMMDVYKDMEECAEMISDLYEAITVEFK